MFLLSCMRNCPHAGEERAGLQKQVAALQQSQAQLQVQLLACACLHAIIHLLSLYTGYKRQP